MYEPGWHLPYMTSGERILWQTEPEKRRLSFRWIALGVSALLALMCIPVGMLLYGVLVRHGSPHIPAVFVCVMAGVWLALLLCQYMLPWLLRQLGRRQTEYAVTDKRILRWRGGQVDSVMLHQLPEPTLLHEPDGTSTLIFWPVAAHNPERDSGRVNLGSMAGFSLHHMQHGEQLCRALRETRVKHERPRPIAGEPFLPIEPGERLLWQGEPAKRDRLLRNWLSGRPVTGEKGGWFFGSWMLAASLGFAGMVLAETGWQWEMWPMYLVLLGMALIGALMLIIPLTRGTRRARHTLYVLTDRRLIRSIDGFVSECRLDRGEALPIYLAQGQGGTATLMLCSFPVSRGGTRVTFSDAAAPMEGFQLRQIGDAARVADLIAAVQAYHT